MVGRATASTVPKTLPYSGRTLDTIIFWLLPPSLSTPPEAERAVVRKPVNHFQDFNAGSGQFVMKTMLFADVVGYSKIPEA